MKVLERFVGVGLVGLSVALGGACTSGGDGEFASSSVTVAITDAASEDIASFLVEVESFRLRKSNGAFASVLSSPVTIDLTSLTDLSQVLNLVSVPAGFYTGATVTFDFTNAVCVLNGQTTPATLLDADGQPLTGPLTLPVEFGAGVLNAVAGKHKLLELDFDLDQSLVTDTGANSVSLEPILVMRVDPAAPKELVALGTLQAVDTAASTFTATTKTLGGPAVGTLRFSTSALTVYHIDGVPATGAAGLTALEAKGQGTWIQVFGAIDPDNPRILALYVAAGTGTYNGGSDIVEGHVLGRSSGAGTDVTLTVKGHSNDATHTSFQFNTTFTVSTSFANTKVVQLGSPLALDLDDVNIGQRVRVFGSLVGTSLDASGATDVVRMQPTFAFGFADAAPVGNVLTMNLSRVGLVPQGDFTWSESGANPPDPAAFTCDVGTLGTGLGITTGTPLRVRGFFAPVDDAGQDLGALSLTNLATAPSLLFVRDLETVGLSLTVTPGPGQIQLVLTGVAAVGEAAVIDQGFVGVQTLPSSPTPRLVPPVGAKLYVIHDKVLNSTGVYLTFIEFSNALALALAQGGRVSQIAAIGAYDVATNTITAPLAGALVE